MNTNSIKKQSIVQSGPWGLEEFVAPLNKMGVKKSESMHANMQDADLPLPFPRINPVPYMHMVMTGRGPRPVQCRLPADNEIAVVDWVNFTDSVATLDIKFSDNSTKNILTTMQVHASNLRPGGTENELYLEFPFYRYK